MISRSYSALRSGLASAQLVVGLLPLLLGLGSTLNQLASVCDHLVGHLEGFVSIEAERFLGSGNFLLTQRGAVGLARALELGCWPADDGLQADKARPISDGPSSLEGVSKCGDILAVVMSVTVSPVHRLHMPAVRGVASRGVLGESDVGVVLDRDPVAVIDQGEIAEPLRSR